MMNYSVKETWMKTLVLGSTSPYRKQLLESLMIPFICSKPLCDEEKYKSHESDPLHLAALLARKKAESLVQVDHVVIGADQLVSFKNQILGKPHHFEGAFQQLSLMQNQTHELITSVCVAVKNSPRPEDVQWIEWTDVTRLTLKALRPEQIQIYLEKDKPWDCAGSYKIEKHGLSLMTQIESQDFTSIQGLPLLRLSQVLHNLGYEIPQSSI